MTPLWKALAILYKCYITVRPCRSKIKGEKISYMRKIKNLTPWLWGVLDKNFLLLEFPETNFYWSHGSRTRWGCQKTDVYLSLKPSNWRNYEKKGDFWSFHVSSHWMAQWRIFFPPISPDESPWWLDKHCQWFLAFYRTKKEEKIPFLEQITSGWDLVPFRDYYSVIKTLMYEYDYWNLLKRKVRN